ncbi:MAG TPA: 4'-phosphopantetheinyl transferase superfamily protein [Acidimicrobiales bacterium]|nr:4'-phosphopantetheinyl transferase superfamily protein [Acidimicrobiales bacterium]
MIEGLLPRLAVSAEERHDPPEAVLLPAEDAIVARAVPERRREFATGRLCARRALARLGLPPGAILAGPAGQPLWPDGIVGSITHCAGYRAAAVARSGDVGALGIDAEPHAPLPDGVLDTVASDDERAHLHRLAGREPDVRWDRLLFSAKESAYKAWYPTGGRILEFEEATVALDPDGTLSVRLVDGTTLAGRWLVADGLVLTVATATATANYS